MAQATGADHDRGRAGHEQRQRALDRVVRREAGVGERRGLDRVEVAERHEVAGVGHQHVLRPCRRRCRGRRPRRRARPGARSSSRSPARSGGTPAAPRAVDGDRARRPRTPAHAGAERIDPAGVLVAERERRTPGQQAAFEVVHQVEVGVAGPGAADPDAHLTGAGLWVPPPRRARVRASSRPAATRAWVLLVVLVCDLPIVRRGPPAALGALVLGTDDA